MTEAVEQATEIINSRGVASVDLAIVLGDGLGGVADGLTRPQLLHHVFVIGKEIRLFEGAALWPAECLPLPACLVQSRVDPIYQGFPFAPSHLGKKGKHD